MVRAHGWTCGYLPMSILMLHVAQSVRVGASHGIAYEISSDSTHVRVVNDGADLITAKELLYSLPDSVYAAGYGKPYFMLPPPAASDVKPWRRLEKLSVAPDGGHVAVVANTGAGVDILLKRVTDGQLMVVGWWHHAAAEALYWSPDSRYLLISLHASSDKSKLIFLELTSEVGDPVRKAAAWESEIGWKSAGDPPAWDLETGSVTITFEQLPTEPGNTSAAAVTPAAKVIHFTSAKPDSAQVGPRR